MIFFLKVDTIQHRVVHASQQKKKKKKKKKKNLRSTVNLEESIFRWNNVNGAVHCSVAARTELFLKNNETKKPEQIILKTMPRIASKVGATLKGNNLLPEEGANSFLSSSPFGKEAKYLV